MIDADDAGLRAEQRREDGGEVAAAAADVEDAGVGARGEVREEGFGGRGVHVRCGDGGGVADCLGGVGVGGFGAEVCAIDLVVLGWWLLALMFCWFL